MLYQYNKSNKIVRIIFYHSEKELLTNRVFLKIPLMDTYDPNLVDASRQFDKIDE